jgi:hypothetical protein
MPRGLPDDYDVVTTEPMYPVADWGEVAARIVPVMTHDRRGQVLWYDGFEYGGKLWSTDTYGTGASAAVSTERARNGNYSMKLITGSVAGGYAGTSVRLGIAPSLRIGVQLYAAFATSYNYFVITMQCYTGKLFNFASIRYTRSTNTFAYIGADGNYYDFAGTLGILEDSRAFHFFKLVVDFNTHMYVRFIFNEVEYDMSKYQMQYYNSLISGRLLAGFWLYGRGTTNDTCYIDDFVITQRED